MNLEDTIRELLEERARIDEAIQALERLMTMAAEQDAPVKRRGRKFMAYEDRKEVSARMKRYWEKRKAQQSSAASPTDDSPDHSPEPSWSNRVTTTAA